MEAALLWASQFLPPSVCPSLPISLHMLNHKIFLLEDLDCSSKIVISLCYLELLKYEVFDKYFVVWAIFFYFC